MNETRRQRVASVIQEEVSMLLRDVKDPRVVPLSISRVEVVEDASFATLYITLLGSLIHAEEVKETGTVVAKSARMEKCLEGLRSSAPFMRRHLSKVLSIKHIPELQFKPDVGFENTLRVFELLKQIEGEKKSDGKTGQAPKASGGENNSDSRGDSTGDQP